MEVPVRIVYLGGKKIGFELLSYLIENPENLNYQIVGVLENQSSRLSSSEYALSALAQNHQIPVLNGLDDLMDLEVDWIFSVQYSEILKQQHIDRARLMAVNLHMAPLPEYRGAINLVLPLQRDAKNSVLAYIASKRALIQEI